MTLDQLRALMAAIIHAGQTARSAGQSSDHAIKEADRILAALNKKAGS